MSLEPRKPMTLLCAEDDADYRLLTRRALKGSRLDTTSASWRTARS